MTFQLNLSSLSIFISESEEDFLYGHRRTMLHRKAKWQSGWKIDSDGEKVWQRNVNLTKARIYLPVSWKQMPPQKTHTSFASLCFTLLLSLPLNSLPLLKLTSERQQFDSQVQTNYSNDWETQKAMQNERQVMDNLREKTEGAEKSV